MMRYRLGVLVFFLELSLGALVAKTMVLVVYHAFYRVLCRDAMRWTLDGFSKGAARFRKT